MKSLRLQIITPYLLLAIAFAVLAARAQYSFCWIDESFYIALADRFYDGAVPFIDEWHPAQVYAPLLVPVYALYLHIAGTSDGVILFFRYVYLLISFLTALVLYKVLSQDHGRFASCAIALCYLFYIRANIQGLSYYSLCTTFFVLSLLCAWGTWQRIRDKRDADGAPGAARVLLPFGGGAFMALAIICNPYIIVIFALACLIGLVVCILTRKMSGFVPFAWAIVGAAVIVGIYLWHIFMQVSPADILANLGNVLSSHDENLTFAERIPNYLSYLPVSRIGFIGTCLLIVFLVVWRITRREITARLKLIVICLDLVFLVAAVAIAFFTTLYPNKAFIAFVEFAIPIYLLSPQLSPRKHPELLCFWLPGIALSFVWQFSSNTQVSGMIIGYSVAAYGAFITVLEVFSKPKPLDALADDDVEFGRQLYDARFAKIGHVLACCSVALIVVVTIAMRLTSIYSDAPWSSLDTEIQDGPAAGLITSAQHVADYEGVRELIGHIDNGSSVWIEPMSPWAYVECVGMCGVPSAWNTFPDEHDFSVYYDELGHERPKWILITDDNLGWPVNIIAGREKAFPALEFYYDYTAELREKLANSTDYQPLVSTEYGTLYKHTEFSSISER